METILFSSAYWHEIKGKLSVYENLLEVCKPIDFGSYSEKMEKLLIIFQCFPKDLKSRKVEEFQKMRRKTKTLELYLIADYNKILRRSDKENYEYIKEVFLKGCETFLKPIKGFDWEQFHIKLTELL